MATTQWCHPMKKELEQKLHLRRTIIFREDDEVETTKDLDVLIWGLRPSFVMRTKRDV